MATGLKPNYLYQLWEYPKKVNYRKPCEGTPCQVFVILEDVDDDGIAHCRVMFYTERPRFLPSIRKGAKLYLPQHYLHVPELYPKLHKDPFRWVSTMEEDLNQKALEIPQTAMAAVMELANVKEVYGKLLRPQEIRLKPKQIWVNKNEGLQYTIKFLEDYTVTYEDRRGRTLHDSIEEFKEMLREDPHWLLMLDETLIGKVIALLKPYFPAVFLTLLGGWLLTRIGKFEISGHLDDDLKQKCWNWADEFLGVATYEQFLPLMEVFLRSEHLAESDRPFAWNFINEIRREKGLRRL